MAKASIIWTGVTELSQAIKDYGDKVVFAAKSIADYFQPVIEAYARDNASWVDRTSNARQGLHAVVEELSNKTIVLYLYHQMDYGKWLELKYSGRYAIVLPSLEAHYAPVMKMLKEIFE